MNIEYNNKPIILANFVTFLGLTLDFTLSWKQHIDAIIPKLNKACYIIRRLKLHLSTTVLHCTSIQSHLLFLEQTAH